MRAMLSGFITFGMINIPIKLYSGSEDHSLHFDLFHEKDLAPIRYARFCTEENKEVPWEEIVKGYEYEEGQYIFLTKEDFDAAKIESDKTIEIQNFVDLAEIPPMFYEKPYYLEPGKGGSKPYFLLLEALKESKKVAIARFNLHDKEHYAALIPADDILVLNQIRMLEDLRDYSALNIPKSKVTKQELDIAVELIERQTSAFNPQTFVDAYKENLQDILKKKGQGKKVKSKKAKKVETTKVVDLMGLLKKSLEGEKKKRKSA